MALLFYSVEDNTQSLRTDCMPCLMALGRAAEEDG